MDKLRSLSSSRRLWAAVSGVIVVVLQDVIGLTEDQALTVAGIVSAWVVGDALRRTE